MQLWSVGPAVDDPTVTRLQDLAREMQDTMFPPFRPRWFRAHAAWKNAWADHFREHPELLAERRAEGKLDRFDRRVLRRRGVVIP